MRVAIYGGSFSPVHAGHMAVARGVLGAALAGEVWMMPCRRNPLKDGSELWPDEKRIRLLKEAIDFYGDDRIKISRQELAMADPSYTVDTFKALKEKYPALNFRLIVGADSYMNFRKWREWEWLEENAAPIVYPRPGYTIGRLPASWTILDGVEQHDISSSELRKMMAEGRSIKDYMPWLKPETRI